MLYSQVGEIFQYSRTLFFKNMFLKGYQGFQKMQILTMEYLMICLIIECAQQTNTYFMNVKIFKGYGILFVES